jgi:hypothetical protein
MKKYFIETLAQRKFVVPMLILAIMIAAFAVRIYKHEDWLYFKMDQARDAMLISKAIADPGYLPLLGPRAGATTLESGFLRLGPVYYYFQYLAALIAHSTEPYVMAYPDLFFSLAAIALVYFFSRLYFSQKHALMIMAMYAFSFIIIQYSRFAWNPNSLQFFLLLTFFGLLKFINEEDAKKKKWWIALWTFALAIGSQLHFFGFFSLLGISGLVILYSLKPWSKESWKKYFQKTTLLNFSKYFAIVTIIFVFIYAPVIISDVFEKGQNANNFIEALGSKPTNKPLIEKIGKNLEENLNYYCLITTSDCYAGDLGDNTGSVLVTGLILMAGLFLSVWNFIKIKDEKKRNFLVLLMIWIGVFFILTIPISFQLRPRFFIVVFAVPFIFLGLLFEFLENRYGKKMFFVALLVTMAIIISNMYGTYAWFSEQSASQNSRIKVKRTLILKAKDGVTLGELQRVADFIYIKHKEGANIYYYVKPEHERPIQYLLEEKHDPNFNFSTLKINKDPNAQYFAIVPDKKDGLDSVGDKYKLDFDVLSREKVGQLLVAEINFPTRAVSAEFKVKKDSGSEDRLFWKDVFGTKVNVK